MKVMRLGRAGRVDVSLLELGVAIEGVGLPEVMGRKLAIWGLCFGLSLLALPAVGFTLRDIVEPEQEEELLWKRQASGIVDSILTIDTSNKLSLSQAS